MGKIGEKENTTSGKNTSKSSFQKKYMFCCQQFNKFNTLYSRAMIIPMTEYTLIYWYFPEINMFPKSCNITAIQTQFFFFLAISKNFSFTQGDFVDGVVNLITGTSGTRIKRLSLIWCLLTLQEKMWVFGWVGGDGGSKVLQHFYFS